MKWVEVVSLQECNSRCRFCPSWRVPENRRMSVQHALESLRIYRGQGADRVDFGGGEPTLRDDTPSMLRGARALGYSEIGIITNGWRLADEAYLEACVDAGLTEATFSLWASEEKTYDELSQTQGGYSLLRSGIRNAAAHKLRLIANLMCSSRTQSDLDAMIKAFAPLGVSEFVVHVVSTYAMERDVEARSMVPDLIAAGLSFQEAVRTSASLGVKKLWTTHLPPCVLGSDRDRYVNCRDLEMVILTSAGGFPLESTPGEGGLKIEPCFRCAWSGRCHGVRKEDVQRGIGPRLQPIREAAA